MSTATAQASEASPSTAAASTATTTTTAPPAQTPTIKAGASETAAITTALQTVAPDLIASVAVGSAPTDFHPLSDDLGSTWMSFDFRIANTDSSRVDALWQIAMTAGETRAILRSAGKPFPFGYTVTGVMPDGSRVEPVNIALGVIPASDVDRAGAEAFSAIESRVRAAAEAEGLSVDVLAQQGHLSATVIKVSGPIEPADLFKRWSTIVNAFVGNDRAASWLLEFRSTDGAPIKAFAVSETTGGAVGWTRPDLRLLEKQISDQR